MQADDVGRCDGWGSSPFAPSMYVPAHTRAPSYTSRSQPVEGDALMDEEHPLPLQQWKCLKHPGLQGLAMSQSAILVTYGPAMVSTPGPLLWARAWRDW